MARVDSEQKLLPSVLDRLVDERPRETLEGPNALSHKLSNLKDTVKRDLEWLLNSRQAVADLPDDLRQIDRSLLTYGLPDFTSTCLSNESEQELLRRTVEEAICRFEPRLSRVHVEVEAGREVDRSLRFRIDAMLNVEPQPEPITFDSILQLSTKTFVVSEE